MRRVVRNIEVILADWLTDISLLPTWKIGEPFEKLTKDRSEVFSESSKIGTRASRVSKKMEEEIARKMNP
jgi:hypothetical protein